MTIVNRLGRCPSMLSMALAMGVGLLAATQSEVQAQTQEPSVQPAFPVALDADVIDPAKLKENSPELAQRRRRRRRAATTSSDFVGLGLSIGTGDGDGALEELGLAAISKLSFSEQLSVRPSVIFNDSAAFLVPVTYNFQSPADALSYSIYPYVGGGIAINATEDDVAPMVNAGVDVPLGERLTLNGQGNVTLADDVTLNFMLGLGYNIDGLF